MERIIRITNDDSEISFDKESSLLELLISKKIDIDHSCGGMGTCGTCKVFVKSDPKHLPKRNDIEQERANDLNFSDSERLACQLPPFNKLAIEIP